MSHQDEDFQRYVARHHLVKVVKTAPLHPCDPETAIVVYRRPEAQGALP